MRLKINNNTKEKNIYNNNNNYEKGRRANL